MRMLKWLARKYDSVSFKLMFSPKVSTIFGVMLMAGGAILVTARIASAITPPVSGSFAYDIYDIAVNDMVKGPVGYVGGVGAMAWGAFSAIQQKLGMAVASVLGGAALIKADAITQSLGLIF